MKKFYLFFLAVAALSTNLKAQSTCPNPNGLGLPISYGSNCFVYVTNTLPDADISVYSGVVRINLTESKTDNLGRGSVAYGCGQTITLILLTTPGGLVCEISGAAIAAPAALPVKLTNFRVQLKENNAAVLQWASEFELDSYKYIVEKSTDGRNYTAIKEVAAAGSSMTTLQYNVEDGQLGNGAAFYRLRMIDIDGRTELSKVVYVNNKKGPGGKLSVFPNPFRSDVQLLGVTTSDINRKAIRVYSISGKEINYSISGANAITIDPSVPTGVYILRIKEQTYKLIKE